MLIDCDTCIARNVACGDCVVTVLLRSPAPRPARRTAPERDGTSRDQRHDRVELDDATKAAIGSLADAGLVPPLRLVTAIEGGLSVDDQETA